MNANAIERIARCLNNPVIPNQYDADARDALSAVDALYQAANIGEELWRAAEMRWMSVEDATIEVPARLIAEIGRARRRVEA